MRRMEALARPTYDSSMAPPRKDARPTRDRDQARSTPRTTSRASSSSSPASTLTRGPYTGHVPRPSVDDSTVRRVRFRRGDEPALPVSARAGQTGLSVAFDLPTQLGYDSDDARRGRGGADRVAIDSIADMELLFDGIPLNEVSTSMTINAPAAMLPCSTSSSRRSRACREETRAAPSRTTSSRSTARAATTSTRRGRPCGSRPTFAYCHERLPRFNTISISGYHIREAGSTAVQELAFTLANGIAYAQAAVDAGLSPDEFGERLLVLLQRAQPLLPGDREVPRGPDDCGARIMKERFGATNTKAMALRFHDAQTGGSTPTAQQPENNIIRVAVQAPRQVAGGAQSIHTNAFDEALALPTERSAKIALRTQQSSRTRRAARTRLIRSAGRTSSRR